METGKEVAIKLEDSTRARKKYLKLEYQIYRKYYSDEYYIPFSHKVNIPKIYHYGQDGDYRVLIMDLLGPSLAELFTFQIEKFSLKTVCMLAIKMITTVEHLHSKGYLHRDIKPGNFVMGRGVNGNEIYLIDYGLASAYIDHNNQHIPYNTNARFHGTDKYASVNTHRKIEPGRRDDMESLGYLWIYFLTSNLPWSKQHAKVKKKNRRESYGQVKMHTTIEELTQNLPNAFYEYFKYINTLKFADKPDYDRCRKLFDDCLTEHNYQFDEVFDWSLQ
uniref:non-specific serine/threonine protein kinase n=1 Tax=Arcella intermedia TaxID=1963864 RepID=A0A6B2LBQ9_9EUKA